VYLGGFRPNSGIEELIEILPDVIKKLEPLEFILIGKGPAEKALKSTVEANNLEEHVRFLGPMSYADSLRYITHCSIGFAPYTERGNLTDYMDLYYCDPSKVKAYLACGCPVVIGRIPWIADLIHQLGAGIAYKDKAELREAIIRLLSSAELLEKDRQEAVKLGRSFDYESVYDDAFRSLDRLLDENAAV